MLSVPSGKSTRVVTGEQVNLAFASCDPSQYQVPVSLIALYKPSISPQRPPRTSFTSLRTRSAAKSERMYMTPFLPSPDQSARNPRVSRLPARPSSQTRALPSRQGLRFPAVSAWTRLDARVCSRSRSSPAWRALRPFALQSECAGHFRWKFSASWHLLAKNLSLFSHFTANQIAREYRKPDTVGRSRKAGWKPPICAQRLRLRAPGSVRRVDSLDTALSRESAGRGERNGGLPSVWGAESAAGAMQEPNKARSRPLLHFKDLGLVTQNRKIRFSCVHASDNFLACGCDPRSCCWI